jgi:hypothetical protein
MEHEIHAIPDKQQYKGRKKIPVIKNMERGYLSPRDHQFIIVFDGTLNKGNGNRIQQGQDKKKDDLLVDGTHQQIIGPDSRAHEMGKNDAQLHEKQDPEIKDPFIIDLLEDKGKEQVDQAT